MKEKLIKILLIFGVILFQISFVNVLISGKYTLSLGLLLTLSLIFVSKFENVWLWILLLGILTDIISGNIGVNVFYFLIWAYLISFLSRQVLMEHHFYRLLLVIIVVTISFFINIGINFFSANNVNMITTFDYAKDSLSFEIYIKNILINLIFFYIIYYISNRTESYINRIKKTKYGL